MKDKSEIDENLYSRQLYVLGHDAMKKMQKSDVLISGIGGLGVEIAKNVILSGVKSVMLHDTENCTLDDLSSQFYLNESSLGSNRAEACVKKLAELNSYVTTNFSTGILNEELIEKFSVIVLTDKTMEEKIAISEICRKLDKKLIVADSRGLFGQIFCDFGEEFIIYDADGLEPKTSSIIGISKDEEGVISCEKWHNLFDGDYVTLSGIEGMTELNSNEPIQITRIGNYTFKIGDTTKFGDYLSGGYVKQVKMPTKMSFKSFIDFQKSPEINLIPKLEDPKLIHLGFIALDNFVNKFKAYPRPWNEEDAGEFLCIAKEVANMYNETVNESFFKSFSKFCSGSICPMNSIIGGIASQEVLKACSGKFTPIHQYFCFDALECLPENIDCKIDIFADNRYKSQVEIFGKNLQTKLNNSKIFVVGAGAIGCELMKNFAMMGIGSENGKVFVTDMDLIEKSNLNRQFLFRPADMQKSKSRVAAESVKKMNNINIEAFESKVCPETENVFDEDFYESLDVIATALDNIDARLYIDRMSTLYRKPLIDSGIMGTLGNLQVVVPHITESYSSSVDPPEKSVPMCTLKHFPTEISHTIQWARDTFEGFFSTSVFHISKYMSDKNYVYDLLEHNRSQAKEIMESIEQGFKTKPNDFMDCVKWARDQFEELFANQIKQLLYNFPPDQITPKGQPFWSGSKKLPSVVKFDPNDVNHFNFILAAANLKAEIFGIKQNQDKNAILKMISNCTVEEFIPQPGVKIALTDEEAQTNSSNEEITEEEALTLIERIKSFDVENFQIQSLVFEKDSDENLHMDFVTATSNLRATNYKIPTTDKHTARQIAGKIIPAIATSTAIVSGLVALEIYKLLQG